MKKTKPYNTDYNYIFRKKENKIKTNKRIFLFYQFIVLICIFASLYYLKSFNEYYFERITYFINRAISPSEYGYIFYEFQIDDSVLEIINNAYEYD